jgi:hypothetical protein
VDLAAVMLAALRPSSLQRLLCLLFQRRRKFLAELHVRPMPHLSRSLEVHKVTQAAAPEVLPRQASHHWK